MKQSVLQELFVEQIRDLYDAEKQLVKALPKLAKASESEDLAEGLRSHLEETQNHVTRLEEVFGMLGVAARGKACKAMKGLVEEGSEAVQENDQGELRDLAIIAGGQRVEHYEISAYGTARTIAEQLGMDDAAALLQQTEDEEKAADAKLGEVAMSLYAALNEGAAEADDESANDGDSVGVSRSSRSTGKSNQRNAGR